MIKTYSQAVKFLDFFIPPPEKKYPGELGLKRMEKLMELLGNPQLSYQTIHVGGTSGKGSTATIIASILAQKYRVGLHTSPHLVRVNERVKVMSNVKVQMSNDIPDEEFALLVNEIGPIVKQMEKSAYGAPSYFEIVSAMAFLYFKKQRVDIAVIEVGMGGTWDATNVIKPLVAVITNVGLDHTEILGSSVEKIAEDKAGIIKPGIKVVSGVKQKSVIKIIENTCKDKDASLSLISRAPLAISARSALIKYKVKKIDEKGSIFDYFGINTYKNLKLSLLGRHQVENAAIAVRVIEKLSVVIRQLADQLSVEDIKTGLKKVFIPGRLEIISKKPLVILDGAHNPEKMRALVSAIKEIFPDKKVKAIIAIKSGKDAQGILKEILPICHEVIFTRFRLMTDLGDTYSYEPEELISKARLVSRAPLAYARSALVALNDAMKNTDSDSLILITGSLYLVGEVKKICRK